MGDIFQSGLSGVQNEQRRAAEALQQLQSMDLSREQQRFANSQASAVAMHEMLHGIRGMGAQGQSQLGAMDHQLAQAQGGQLRNVIAPYLEELTRANQQLELAKQTRTTQWDSATFVGGLWQAMGDGTVTKKKGYHLSIDWEIDELKRKVESFSLLRRDDVDKS